MKRKLHKSIIYHLHASSKKNYTETKMSAERRALYLNQSKKKRGDNMFSPIHNKNSNGDILHNLCPNVLRVQVCPNVLWV